MADCTPLQLAVADALRGAPVDARRQLAGSIVLAGGLASLPGFGARLLSSVAAAVDTSFDVFASLEGALLCGPDAAFSAGARGVALLGGAPPQGLQALRPLLPFLCVANVVAPQNVALAGGSALGTALSAMPRLISGAKTAAAAASAAPLRSAAGTLATGAASLVRSDALAESSVQRGRVPPQTCDCSDDALVAPFTSSQTPQAAATRPAATAAAAVAAVAAAAAAAAATLPAAPPAPAEATAAAPPAPKPPSAAAGKAGNAARLESLSARLRGATGGKKA